MTLLTRPVCRAKLLSLFDFLPKPRHRLGRQGSSAYVEVILVCTVNGVCIKIAGENDVFVGLCVCRSTTDSCFMS